MGHPATECPPCVGSSSGAIGLEQGDGALAPAARDLLSQISWYAAQEGLAPPSVLSACRSRAYQLELQQRWDSGDRRGLTVRPATNSKHIADEDGLCWAFDLGNTHEWLRQVGPVMARMPGVTWGGSWVPPDLPHFEVDKMRLAAVIRLV